MTLDSQYTDRAKWFWAVAGGLFVLNCLLGIVSVPLPGLQIALGILVGIIYISAPLFGLFCAASGEWKWGKCLAWIAAGVALQGGGVLVQGFIPQTGILTVLVQALGQSGLLIWSAGLGMLVSLLFKEKNIIVPVCIFLAGFDAWLIFNPNVFTSQLVQNNSKIFQNVALAVPQPKVQREEKQKPQEPRIVPLAHIGPADLIFSATFFAALFRFRMRVKESIKWLVPILIGYLLLVFLIPGGMLPALVPIGLTILLVNRKEFTMNTEEKQGVWVVTILAIALAAHGIYSRITYKPKARPPATSTSPASPAAPAPARSPAPGGGN